MAINHYLWYNVNVPNGGDLVSTWVTKPEGHAEVENPRKLISNKHNCKRC